MTKGVGGYGDDANEWQTAAMGEQAAAASVPGHVNINVNMNTNVNIDFTPTAEGDYSGLINALREIFSK